MTTTVDQPATEPAPADDERLAYRGPVQRLLTRPEIGALIGTGAIWMFFWAVSDVFGTTAGANNYLDVSTSLGIMAVAVAMLMIGGEFDLSAGAMTGATGMLVVLLVKEPGEFGGAGLPLAIAIPLTLAFALGVGWTNGKLVEKTGLPSFIVTLGTFFILRGAKIGFAKLFTDKVIVEGLDNAPDFEFWSNIFGAVWIRNDHVWDSFLGGRDVMFAVLAIAGAIALVAGLVELSLTRRETPSASGLPLLAVGLAGAIAGIITMTSSDGYPSNWIGSILVAAGTLTGVFGLARWRHRPASRSDASLSLTGVTAQRVGIGTGLIVLGIIFGLVLDSSSQTVLGFLLTVQGLRAVLFGGLVIVGGIMLLSASRSAQGSPMTQLAINVFAAMLTVALAFIIQSESTSRKFRAEFFAWILLVALALVLVAMVRYFFEVRRSADAQADRLGRVLALSGVVLLVLAVAMKLLWSTPEENAASQATITYRVSVLFFLVFAAAATWVLLKTRFGSWTFAVGGNASASRQVGVPAARTKTQLFMLVSAASWLVGLLIAFRLNSVQANVGDGQEFFYIIAAVVGGNLLTGGYGSTAGSAIGAIIMAMSFQGIPFAGWNSDWRFLFVGVILLLAVLVNNYVRSRAEASR
jgi:ribose/xylose/arabinose/galactoside ABC-type transport system permease subunit